MAIGWQAWIDRAPFTVEVGHAGDHRFVHGEHAIHHLSSDAALLRCAPRDREDLRWWRVVLDSVLFTVALIRGREALHAGAVVTQAGAIAITAPTGGGKSTLLAELVCRGHPLLADDVVVLEPRVGLAPLAHPAPPLMTIPASRANGSGRIVAQIEDEQWIAVPAYRDPVPLAALIVLDRRVGAKNELRKMPNTLPVLMASLMHFPRQPDRERARFELASVLSSHTSVVQLIADSKTDPGTLVELLRAETAFAVEDDLAS
jgi:hypothetical protein